MRTGLREIKVFEFYCCRCKKTSAPIKAYSWSSCNVKPPKGWGIVKVGPCGSHYEYYRDELVCRSCYKKEKIRRNKKKE